MINRRNFLHHGGLAAIAPGLLSFTGLDTTTTDIPGEIDTKIRLFSNENPFGPSEAVKKVIADEIYRSNCYASYYKYSTDELKNVIAQKHGCDPKQVILGHGSFDILCMLGVTYGQSRNAIISPNPTFNIAGRLAERINGHKQVTIPLNADMDIDLTATEQAVTNETQLAYICNPNNPTGKYLPADKIIDFCQAVAPRCTVAIDEAYIDFIEPSERPDLVSLIDQGLDIIVIRTLSKAYGMAGLRIGYAIGMEDTIDRLNMDRIPFGGLKNYLGVVAAITALQDDTFIDESRVRLTAMRRDFEKVLDEIGLQRTDSRTNFVYVDVRDLARFRAEMKQADIWPISGGSAAYPEWARISMATPEQMTIVTNRVRGMSWLRG